MLSKYLQRLTAFLAEFGALCQSLLSNYESRCLKYAQIICNIVNIFTKGARQPLFRLVATGIAGSLVRQRTDLGAQA